MNTTAAHTRVSKPFLIGVGEFRLYRSSLVAIGNVTELSAVDNYELGDKYHIDVLIIIINFSLSLLL